MDTYDTIRRKIRLSPNGMIFLKKGVPFTCTGYNGEKMPAIMDAIRLTSHNEIVCEGNRCPQVTFSPFDYDKETIDAIWKTMQIQP